MSDNHDDERLGLEKRKFVRIDVTLPVFFKVIGDDTGMVYEAVTRNISHGGLCVRIDEKKEELTEKFSGGLPSLQISLELRAEMDPVEVSTKTAWIRSKVDWMSHPAHDQAPLLLGLAFENVAEAERDSIDTFIADLLIRMRERDED